jgi:hypothetical protein
MKIAHRKIRSSIFDPRSSRLRPSPFVVALFVLLALAVIIPAIGRAQESQPNRAGVVIRHGDGRVVTACVSFAEPEISGTDLLDRAGIPYLAQGISIGAAVCQLDGEGCAYPAEDCFCKCKSADCIYWIYHHLRDGAWSYSQISASRSKIQPGDVDGWAWGEGNNQAGAQPPALSFGEVCPAPGAETSPAPPSEPPPPPPATTPPLPPPSETIPPAAATPTAIAPATAIAKPTAAEPPTERVATTAAAPVQTSAPGAPLAPSATRAPATAPPTEARPDSTRPPPTGAVGGAIATRAPQAPPGAPSTTSYLAFGALALLLGGGIAAALLRRRTG